jgi:hypothetical protein
VAHILSNRQASSLVVDRGSGAQSKRLGSSHANRRRPLRVKAHEAESEVRKWPDIVAEVGGNPGNWPRVSCCSGVKPVMPLVLLPAAAAGTP